MLRARRSQLYLNEGMKGGETSFPRWVNAETFRELKAVPEVGKAVLFYSQLPDGNLDDFSQHAALPVTEGEKVSSLRRSFCFLKNCVGEKKPNRHRFSPHFLSLQISVGTLLSSASLHHAFNSMQHLTALVLSSIHNAAHQPLGMGSGV